MAFKDTFFISHGMPSLVFDASVGARKFFKGWQKNVFSQRPTSILIISAHWDTTFPMVSAVDGINDTIYDFYGYRKKIYQLKYPAPGAPELAHKVKELLTNSGFPHVGEDTKRGLDHGAWIPLYLMYPEADIPVCQLSVQSNEDGPYHYKMGKALAPLKDEGVLIIGSGSATYNLRQMYANTPVFDWTQEFDDWLKNALLEGRYEDINHYELYAPHARTAHPWPDHFFPLHFAIGAAGDDSKAKQLFSGVEFCSLSHASYQFTSASS